MTFNVSGSLLEQLEELKAHEFFHLVKKLIADGKVELVHSIMYHSLVPLISDEMLDRAIQENIDILNRTLGQKVFKGFFPPELAINAHGLSHLKDKYVFVGYHSVKNGPILRFQEKTLLVANQKVVNLFRAYPKKLNANKVFRYLENEYPKDSLFILPNDAELFGHHYSERLKLLSDLLDSTDVTFLSVQEAIEKFGQHAPEVKRIRLSTWQNTDGLNLWIRNKLQRKYLKFARLAAQLTSGSDSPVVTNFLDQGWSSCYLYWLSNWPWWYPDIVEGGAKNLIKSVRSSANLSNESKAKAEKAYFHLLNAIWTYHWSDQVQENYTKYDQSREKKLVLFEDL